MNGLLGFVMIGGFAFRGLLFPVFALFAASTAWVHVQAQAPSPPPPLPEAELVEFYQATDGDNWFRNDGWLDPEVEVCDWYGIRCEINAFGFREIAGVVLPDNNLSGELAETVMLRVPTRRLELSGNRLTGPLPELPLRMQIVDLSRNQLSGNLPAALSDGPGRLSRLDLSLNRLEGMVPDDWSELELQRLNLSNNRLDGGAENAFAAIRTAGGAQLDLADNRFFGPLAPEVSNTRFSAAVRSLNLCWNDFVIDDDGLAEWISEHHVGGENWEICLNRARTPVDLTVSGSWYVPERSGEGVSLQLLEGGGALLYSFTFDLDGRQLWKFEVGRAFEKHSNWPWLWETRGDFGSGLRRSESVGRLIRQIGALRMDRLEDRMMQFEREFVDHRSCRPLEEPESPGMLCPVWFLSDRFNNTQLTRLAGTTCDNRDFNQWISGAWYDPERSGEGFVVEVIETGEAVVYWFTYAADGSGLQAWMTGVGEVTIPPIGDPPPPRGNPSAIIRVDDLVQPIGGVWGPEFDRDAIERVHWGTLTLELSRGDTGHAIWNSVFDDFGAGDHPLVRLARPKLADCSDE